MLTAVRQGRPFEAALDRAVQGLPENDRRLAHEMAAGVLRRQTALDARLGWMVREGVELSLTGVNLTDRRHPEFGAAPARSELPRTFYLRLRCGF